MTNMQAQCLPVYGAECEASILEQEATEVDKTLCAEDLTRSTIVPALPKDRRALLEHGVLPPGSSAKDRFCVMCLVKRGSPRLLPCCLCHNWCHTSCSYQAHLGRVCPCHVQILDPRRKIIVLRHPYREDCVVRAQIIRISSEMWQIGCCEMTASWLNLLFEKHAWLSTGLVWMHGASKSGVKGVFEGSGPDGLESRPTINFFKQWEVGAHLPKLVNARNYFFPKSLVVPIPGCMHLGHCH